MKAQETKQETPTINVAVRLPMEKYQELRAEAARIGLTPSGFCRVKVYEALNALQEPEKAA